MEGAKGKANPKGYQSPYVSKSWGRGSSAVAEWDPPSSSASHTGHGGYTAGGQNHETFDAEPWKEVRDPSYPSEWSNDPPKIVEYNEKTKEYRYHWECDPNKPAHRAFPERAA